LALPGLCRPCELGFQFQNSSNKTSCKTLTSCGPGSFQIGPPSISSDRVCAQCSPGTSQSKSNEFSCSLCLPDSFSDQPGSSDCKKVSPVCPIGQYELQRPTASSDRVCADINACLSFPCALHSSGCTDLPAPAPNAPFGRVCKACNVGYVGDGATCVSQSVYDLRTSTCFCPPSAGFSRTECGETDVQGCIGQPGRRTRLCLGDQNWQDPVDECLNVTLMAGGAPMVDSCALFPCPRNSKGCTLIAGQPPGENARTCGDCRTGYTLEGSECKHAILSQYKSEPWNEYTAVDNFKVMSEFAGSDTVLGVSDAEGVFAIMSIVTQVILLVGVLFVSSFFDRSILKQSRTLLSSHPSWSFHLFCSPTMLRSSSKLLRLSTSLYPQ
jgi:hypothetical protein